MGGQRSPTSGPTCFDLASSRVSGPMRKASELRKSSALARGPFAARALVAAVGFAWLVASFLPAAVLLHQAVLVVALLAFPSGRLRGAARWLLALAAVPVGALLVPQPGVAALFAGVAVSALPRVRVDPVAGMFPFWAGTAMAAVVGLTWSVSRLAPEAFDPAIALLGYGFVLLAVAAGFCVSARAVVADRARLADRLIGDEQSAGLAQLSGVLAETLRDPGLRVVPAGDIQPAVPSTAHSEQPKVRRLEVRVGPRTLAVVLHRSAALDDGPTAEAVAAAVRLVALNVERRAELQRRVEALRAARARVVAAADRQRGATAARLRVDVIEPLERTASALRDASLTTSDPVAAESVGVAVQQMASAVDDIGDLVAGVPSMTLGGGRLRSALEELSRHGSLPVSVTADPRAATSPERELALFYVCSEALTNANKHSNAGTVSIELCVEDRWLILTVADDGCGGAEVSGSGLRGLADRLEVVGGRLRVDSPPGAGTTVTARVPR